MGAGVLGQEGRGLQQGLKVVAGLVVLQGLHHLFEGDLAQRLLHLHQEALRLAAAAPLRNILGLREFLHRKPTKIQKKKSDFFAH